MADGDTQLGTGSTFAFSGVAGDLVSLSLGDMSRDSVEVHHMGTTGFRPKLFGRTYSTGTITAELHFDSTAAATSVIVGVEATLTLNIGKAASDGSVWVYSAAAVTAYSWNDPVEDVMTATVEWELNSEPSIS